jgi:hypothetical protein
MLRQALTRCPGSGLPKRRKTVTESEWLQSRQPALMVTTVSYNLKRARTKDGRRKLRLSGCACCRRAIRLFPDESFWPLVDLAERVADGAASQSEIDTAFRDPELVSRDGESDQALQARTCLHLAVGKLGGLVQTMQRVRMQSCGQMGRTPAHSMAHGTRTSGGRITPTEGTVTQGGKRAKEQWTVPGWVCKTCKRNAIHQAVGRSRGCVQNLQAQCNPSPQRLIGT